MWGPTAPRWRGADTIAFTMQHVTDEPGRTRPEPALLVREGGTWRVRPGATGATP
jgi:hypothetical protein